MLGWLSGFSIGIFTTMAALAVYWKVKDRIEWKKRIITNDHDKY